MAVPFGDTPFDAVTRTLQSSAVVPCAAVGEKLDPVATSCQLPLLKNLCQENA